MTTDQEAGREYLSEAEFWQEMEDDKKPEIIMIKINEKYQWDELQEMQI